MKRDYVNDLLQVYSEDSHAVVVMKVAVAELKAEQEAHNALKENLKEIEEIYDNGYPCCPACGVLSTKADGKGHSQDCWLAKAIKGVE